MEAYSRFRKMLKPVTERRWIIAMWLSYGNCKKTLKSSSWQTPALSPTVRHDRRAAFRCPCLSGRANPTAGPDASSNGFLLRADLDLYVGQITHLSAA